ncbi:unnamed protein product [Amoebophrya sp. A25]|nr:unnamed protein product [Amoebophrya sp. A25]|eukprot:GSA25T00013672001.1
MRGMHLQQYKPTAQYSNADLGGLPPGMSFKPDRRAGGGGSNRALNAAPGPSSGGHSPRGVGRNHYASFFDDEQHQYQQQARSYGGGAGRRGPGPSGSSFEYSFTDNMNMVPRGVRGRGTGDSDEFYESDGNLFHSGSPVQIRLTGGGGFNVYDGSGGQRNGVGAPMTPQYYHLNVNGRDHHMAYNNSNNRNDHAAHSFDDNKDKGYINGNVGMNNGYNNGGARGPPPMKNNYHNGAVNHGAGSRYNNDVTPSRPQNNNGRGGGQQGYSGGMNEYNGGGRENGYNNGGRRGGQQNMNEKGNGRSGPPRDDAHKGGKKGAGKKGKGRGKRDNNGNDKNGTDVSPPMKNGGGRNGKSGKGNNKGSKSGGKKSGSNTTKGKLSGSSYHQRLEDAEGAKRRRAPCCPELAAWRETRDLQFAVIVDAGEEVLLEFCKDPEAHVEIADALKDEAYLVETRRQAVDMLAKMLVTLSNDMFGHNVALTLFEGNIGTGMAPLEVRSKLVDALAGRVFEIATHETGCRTLQHVLETLNVDLQVRVALDLKGKILEAVEDQNGNHVLQKLFERMPTRKVQFIINAFRGEVRRMATHCYGSRVLQRIIEYCDPEQVAQIYDEIHDNNLSVFIHDSYGNYVIQNMVEYGRPSDRQAVFEIVNNYLATMACHKFASNIVEKSIQQGNKAERKHFLDVALGKVKLPKKSSSAHDEKKAGEAGDETPAAAADDKNVEKDPPIVTMMKDKYGNYVVQKLMQVAEGADRDEIVERMKNHLGHLEKLPYGRHVLFALREGEYGLEGQTTQEQSGGATNMSSSSGGDSSSGSVSAAAVAEEQEE